MSSAIQPLSGVSESAVTAYLVRNGHSDDIVSWKYFDRDFNRGRERGYVYLEDGGIAGFIGLIPFTVRHRGESRAAAWTCDWYRDPGSKGVMGLMLIKHCFQSYSLLYSSGGSPLTRQILPRLSANTIPDGVRVMHKPLRAGALLNIVGDRVKRNLREGLPRLAKVPLPFALTSGGCRDKAVITEGISRNILPLLQTMRDDAGPRPEYDPEYLAWQIGACPSITCGSCYTPRDSEPRAGAVFWTFHPTNGYWRMAIWGRPGATEEIKAVVSAITHHAYRNGAALLSVMTSRLDGELMRVLKSCGFRFQQKRPVYILRSSPEIPVDEPRGLSFLDTDAAYR